MELFKASNQWKTRPDDERFWDLPEMLAACQHHVETARVAHVKSGDLSVCVDGQDLSIVGPGGEVKARMTHFAFGQLAQRAGAPANYLRELPPTLAAHCLNVGLTTKQSTDTALLFHQNGDLVLRAATSEQYERVWNAEVVLGLCRMAEGPEKWRLPPARAVTGCRSRPATQADVLQHASHASLGVKVGDMISPSAAYASDHDMFVFMVDDGKRIEVGDTSLSRGFFVWNSEVGDKSLGIQTFLFDAVCGNHIVWKAQDVQEMRIRHVGQIRGRWEHDVEVELIRYANTSTSDDKARIESSRRMRIAATKDDVIETLFGRKALGLSKKAILGAYEIAESTPRYGDPRSPWAIANGLTEASQRTSFADERVRLDRAAGRVLEIAF